MKQTLLIAVFSLLPFPALAVGASTYDHVLEELKRKEEIVWSQIQGLKEEAKSVEKEIQKVLGKRMAAASKRDQEEVTRLDRELARLLSGNEEIRRAEEMLVSLQRDREALLAFSRASESTMLRDTIVAAKAYLERDIARLPGVDVLTWPVIPSRGISAHFGDKEYTKRFGIPHHAVDIPVAQGSKITAPRDGVVVAVSDQGYGYSTVEMQHGKNLRTRYGHVSEILVKEGQVIKRGAIIGLTGGRPGTKGAGFLTTGPHLHFEVIVAGRHIDPLTLLPQTYDLTYRPLSGVGGE